MQIKRLMFISFLLLNIESGFCADITWIGSTSNDVLTATNWNPNVVPGSTDTAIFSANGESLTPTLSDSPATDVNMGTLQFSDATSYNFTLQFAVSRQLHLQQIGVLNLGASNQFFSINGTNSILRFENNSSADSTQSGKVFYHITNVGRVRFANSATASNANIDLDASGGLLEFFSTSTAANAQITMTGNNATTTFFNNSTGGSAMIASTNNGNIVFTNTSKAQNVKIFADKTTLSFSGSSQANSAQITATNGSVVTFNGNSTANTSTIQANASSILFSGAASGADATINLQNHSQVFFNQNNTLATLCADSSSLVNLNSFQLVLGANNANSVIDGIINGIGGSLIKNGSGTLTLNGSNSFTGSTNILGGTLNGSGSVDGDLNIFSGATFAPGNQAIGTFNVGGNYTQNAGSILEASVDGTGQSNLVHAQGMANINGTLQIHSPDGLYRVGTPYLIVHGNEGRTGTFSSSSVDNPYFLPSLEYDATNVFLTLTTDFSNFTANQNQGNVANQIDQITQPDLSKQILINSLAALPTIQLQSSLAQFSGAQYVSLIQSCQFSNHRLIRRLNALNLLLPGCCDCASPLNFWAQFGAGRAFVSNSRRALGLKSSAWNINLGAFKCFNSNITIGLSIDYEFTRLNFNLGGDAKYHLTKGILFAIYQNPLFYTSIDLIGGGGHCQVKRLAYVGNKRLRPRSKPFLSNGTAYFELGKTFCFSQFACQPFLGLDSSNFWQTQVSERHGQVLNLKIHNKDFYALDSLLGFHSAGNFYGIEIETSVDWRHTLTHSKNDIRLHFKNFGGSFRSQGTKLCRNSVEGFLQAGKWLLPFMQIYGQLSGEKGSHFSDYQASVGLDAIY